MCLVCDCLPRRHDSGVSVGDLVPQGPRSAGTSKRLGLVKAFRCLRRCGWSHAFCPSNDCLDGRLDAGQGGHLLLYDFVFGAFGSSRSGTV